MQKLTLNIPEVIAFSMWLSVKQNLRSGLKSVLYSHIWTLGTNNSLAPNFMEIFTLLYHAIINNFYFKSGTNSAPINSEKLMTELNGPHYTELNFEFNSRFGNSSTLRVS
jgi:hypothetical protein